VRALEAPSSLSQSLASSPTVKCLPISHLSEGVLPETRKKSFRAGRITAATAVCHVCMAFGPWTLAAGNGEWKLPWCVEATLRTHLDGLSQLY